MHLRTSVQVTVVLPINLTAFVVRLEPNVLA